MNSDTEKRVRSIISKLFWLPPEDIGSNTSVDTIEKWDSLNHIKLVLALEETFRIEFTEMEIVEMMSYDLVMLTLGSKGLE
jgi:acyl carrier protein